MIHNHTPIAVLLAEDLKTAFSFLDTYMKTPPKADTRLKVMELANKAQIHLAALIEILSREQGALGGVENKEIRLALTHTQLDCQASFTSDENHIPTLQEIFERTFNNLIQSKEKTPECWTYINRVNQSLQASYDLTKSAFLG